MSTAKRDALEPLNHATGRFTKAGESEIDRRTTAVMAHAQLKGALADHAMTLLLKVFDKLFKETLTLWIYLKTILF